MVRDKHSFHDATIDISVRLKRPQILSLLEEVLVSTLHLSAPLLRLPLSIRAGTILLNTPAHWHPAYICFTLCPRASICISSSAWASLVPAHTRANALLITIQPDLQHKAKIYLTKKHTRTQTQARTRPAYRLACLRSNKRSRTCRFGQKKGVLHGFASINPHTYESGPSNLHKDPFWRADGWASLNRLLG